MPANYVLLERIELNATAASITFSNIPQTGYTDLKIVASIREDNVSDSSVILAINGSTANLPGRRLLGIGSGGGISTTITATIGNADHTGYTANTFNNMEIYIPNYLSSNFKSISADSVSENNATEAVATLQAMLWSSTSAITSISLSCIGNILANSTFSLYALAALGTTPTIAPKASGGNRIDYDGTYWYHTFFTSGTFTPQTGLTCDYLVVAGGGGGGYGQGLGGGGGAGGLRSTVSATGGGGALESALSLSVQEYTVTIGGGGAGGPTNVSNGTVGNNSVFSTITSTGGGGGGYSFNVGAVGAGGAGGSGGGAGVYAVTASTGGAASPSGQGYAGGTSISNSENAGGGGGAAGSPTNPNGGTGILLTAWSTSTLTGVSDRYAGGGIGETTNPTQGTANGGGGTRASKTGSTNTGGGGAGGIGAVGGAGGSGIVIVRYLAA